MGGEGGEHLLVNDYSEGHSPRVTVLRRGTPITMGFPPSATSRIEVADSTIARPWTDTGASGSTVISSNVALSTSRSSRPSPTTASTELSRSSWVSGTSPQRISSCSAAPGSSLYTFANFQYDAPLLPPASAVMKSSRAFG